MEHSKNYNHFQPSNREAESVEFGHASQRYRGDPSGRANSNVRPSEHNFTEAKPVHNHSLHTGEEFVYEKMRDRANLNAGDPSLTTGSLEPKGVRGIGHTKPESRYNTSEPKDFERKNSSSYEEKSSYGSAESVPRDSFGYNSNRTSTREYSSAGSSDGSTRTRKITILCSFGGEIINRSQDGKLSYVGGETHSIRIQKEITWEELRQKTAATYIRTHKIKYQLPGEDLDTLVSVSSDEALQNMLEDCNVLGDEEGSKKIRMFLFPVNDLNDTKSGLTSSGGDSEVKYVGADNQRNVGPRGDATRHGLANPSATNMDEPGVQNVARGNSGVASVTAAPTINQYSQPILSKSSNALETQPQSHSHQGQLHHDGPKKILQPISKSDSSFHTPGPGGQRTLPLASSAPVTCEGGLSKDQPAGALVGSPSMLKQEVKVNVRSDAPRNQETEYELIRSMGKYADRLPVKEASPIMLPLGTNSSRSSKKEGSSHLKSVPVTSSYVNNPMRDLKASDKELLTSNSAIASKHVISHNDLIDLSCSEPPLPPQSLSHSDRYNREQGESLNRSTKSDDLGSHTRSNFRQQDSVEESGKRLNNVNPAAKTEQYVSRTKLSKHGISDNELPKFQNINSTETHSNYGKNGTDDQVLNPGDRTSFIKGNMNSVINESTRGNYDKDPASCLPNYTSLDRSASDITSNHSPGKSQSSERTGKAASLENSSGISLQKGVSHDQFSQKDVSLIDQDHIDLSSRLPKVEEKPKAYKLTPPVRGDISSNQISSKNKFDIQKESPGVSESSTKALHSDYAPSLVESKDARQFKESSGNIRIPESEHMGGIRSSHSLKPSFDNLDISSMQIIKDEDLEQGAELGSGTFGTVYHGKWRGSEVAIKRINKKCFTGRSSQQKEKMITDFLREAEILSRLRHPNVVTFYGVVQDGSTGTLATVTEYMSDGSLGHALLLKDRLFDHQKKLRIAMSAAFGMEYLHSKDIVHFDLKCDNLLVDLNDPARPKCKVTDFGLSKIKRKTFVSGGLNGTLPWMAPELRTGKKVSEKVDVFSFGIVLWEILTGEEPYKSIDNDTFYGGIFNNTLRPAIPSYCDPEWKKLMEQCWDSDPTVRPTFTEIANRLRVMHEACQAGTHVHKASK